LLEQFVSNLEATVLAPASAGESATDAGPTAESTSETAPAPASVPGRAPRSRKAAAAKPAVEAVEAVDAAVSSEAPKTSNSSKASAATETTEPEPVPAPTIRRIDSAPAEPVDLVGVAGPSLRKRILPYASIAGAIFLLRIVIYALRRRKK
jgi:hypothetical protein